jgi:hypothetical protein
VPWVDILGRPDLLAFDLQHHLGLRLPVVLRTYGWREFAALVSGLLALEKVIHTARGAQVIPDTAIGAHFHHDEEADDG